MKLLPLALLAAACSAKEVVITLHEVKVPWKEANFTALSTCHTQMTNNPRFEDHHCGGAKWEVQAWKWKSAEDCKNYCQGAIWKGIIKGWKAVKCETKKHGYTCRYSYCQENDIKACRFETNYEAFAAQDTRGLKSEDVVPKK